MTENEIFQIMFAGLQTQGLFLIGFAFLTWFAGRCAVVANESGNANIVSKIVTSAFALSSLWYLNMQFSYVSLVLNNAAHNLAVLKDSGTEVSGFGQNFIETYNASSSQVPTISLINEPIAIILVVSIALILLSAIWMSDSNKE
ncbi:MAG: hypothetical protein VYE11_01015 [Pseudomonadota bacterium]|jgi:hypothetical protein|nr:hypothetical protein [Pseudomonadota bacterium]|tara:strand:- start:868 stop:1299 length:432 start_codon:yes stop_codon:yes gene_type:complete